MLAKSTHIIPTDGGWVIRREGASPGWGDGLYSLQREAVAAARLLTRRESVGQIVIHGRNGSMRITDVRGIRPVRSRRRKSSLGRTAIKKAISAVLRERLLDPRA
ncbi:MAG: DUF2188 domain-containing protein [Bryobacteraceae bacterium]